VKQNEDHHPRRKNFLKIPAFPGGKEAWQEFVMSQLRYPAEALENRIEGSVHVEYSVDNLGIISDIHVTRGLGYGCDQEAVRVIGLMKYEAARNRGVRMKAKMKSRIQFHLPVQTVKTDVQLQYTQPEVQTQKSPGEKSGAVYSYTINLG
jgi:TonB family protein